MIRNWKYTFAFCLLAVFITGCTGEKENAETGTEAVDDETTAGTPFTRNVGHDTCLFIAHTIKDYDLWRASFDLAQPLREKHGINALNVYREKNDSALALVYTEVQHLKKAKDYITSPNLQSSMSNAGVVGALDLYWMSNKLQYTQPVSDSIMMFMSFKVISYDRWENAFLQDYRDEPNRDFQVSNVMRGVEDEGQVSMIFAVNDPDYVKKMEKDNVFRAKMLAAGVISYPVTYKLVSMPI